MWVGWCDDTAQLSALQDPAGYPMRALMGSECNDTAMRNRFGFAACVSDIK